MHEIFECFREFFGVFGCVRTCLNPFWPVRTCPDAFECVQMHLEELDIFEKFWILVEQKWENQNSNEIKHEIKTSKDKINKDSNVSVQVKSEIDKVKSEIDSVTDSVKRDL